MTEPYYQDEWATLYHGDCRDILPEFDNETWDIAVTSPPYNMGLVPGGNGRGMYRPGANNKAGRFRDGYDGDNDDALPYDEYCTLHRGVLAECWRLVRLGVFYNHRPRIEHGRLRFPLNGDYGPEPVLRQIITWDRGTGIDLNLRAFCTRGEWIMVFAKPEFELVDHAASGLGDVWNLGIDHSGIDHPATFPVSLPARCIAATGVTSVLDPFAGSGTTLVAAKKANVRAVGIEKVEGYCDVAARRLSQGVLNFGDAA
jgi:DNA modification methylase